MKAKFLITTAMLLVAASASAQVQASASSASLVPSGGKNYNSVYLHYNPQTKVIGQQGAKDITGYHGITLGYKRGISISNSRPLFLEAGAAFQFSVYDTAQEETHDFYRKGTMGALLLPVNVTYRFAISRSKFAIAPYLGLTVKCNLWASETQKEEWVTGYGYNARDHVVETDRNLFSTDDMGSRSQIANRLQFAWQAGVNFYFKKFYLGVGYGTDLVDFLKTERFNTAYATLGFDF